MKKLGTFITILEINTLSFLIAKVPFGFTQINDFFSKILDPCLQFGVVLLLMEFMLHGIK